MASNLADVRANAEFLRGWLQARGAAPQLLEVPNAPPAVYGEIRVPGATKTLVLYAHYDGQPVNPPIGRAGTRGRPSSAAAYSARPACATSRSRRLVRR